MAKPKKNTNKETDKISEASLSTSATKPEKKIKTKKNLNESLSALPVEQKTVKITKITKLTKAAQIKAEEIKAEQVKTEQLIAQAMLRYKNDVIVEKKIKVKEISHLSSIAEEYLSCFALIGYSLLDEKVVVFNMPTAKDEAALIDLLRSTFLDIAGNRP
jgi:anaerobic C4-dicarboxylate transporter